MNDRRPSGIDGLIHAIVGDRDDWFTAAACIGMPNDWWFPDSGAIAQAVAICRDCPVQTECLEWALRHNEHLGVWGGVSAIRRKRMRREHRAQAQ